MVQLCGGGARSAPRTFASVRMRPPLRLHKTGVGLLQIGFSVWILELTHVWGTLQNSRVASPCQAFPLFRIEGTLYVAFARGTRTDAFTYITCQLLPYAGVVTRDRRPQ